MELLHHLIHICAHNEVKRMQLLDDPRHPWFTFSESVVVRWGYGSCGGAKFD
jgi:hypothetical protein